MRSATLPPEVVQKAISVTALLEADCIAAICAEPVKATVPPFVVCVCETALLPKLKADTLGKVPPLLL